MDSEEVETANLCNNIAFILIIKCRAKLNRGFGILWNLMEYNYN